MPKWIAVPTIVQIKFQHHIHCTTTTEQIRKTLFPLEKLSEKYSVFYIVKYTKVNLCGVRQYYTPTYNVTADYMALYS